MNVMTYKGYTAGIAFDAEDDIFFGNLVGIADVIGFHANNAFDLKLAFHDVVDDYVSTLEKLQLLPQLTIHPTK